MRRILSVAIAALFVLLPMAANAASRIVVYPGQNPLAEQTNQDSRFKRLAFGTWMRDALGSNTAATGVYSNLSVVPNGGMYVAVQPTQANTLGSVYQIGVDDASAVPSGSTWTPVLSADSTKIVLQGLQSAPSGALGPLVAPSSGLQQYYLVEAQLQTVDTASQSITFVNSNRTTSTQTVPTQRVDEIVYQLKAGTAAASPAVPATDSGWIPIATILISSTTTEIASDQITAQPAFSGFIANNSNVTLTGLTLSGTSAGCLQTNSSGVVSSQACTSGLGTVNGSAPISATTSAGVATVSCPTCVTSVSASGNLSSSGGTQPQISLSANPGFSSVTTASATVNGNATIPASGTATSSTNYASLGAFQAQVSTWNGVSASLHTWGLTADTSGKLSFQFDSAPKLTIDSNGNATATTFTGSGAGLTNLPINQFSGLTALRCIRATSATSIAPAAGDCVTGLTAGTGISVGTGTTPTVGIANNGVGQAQVQNGYVDLSSAQTIGGAKTFSVAPAMSGANISAGTIPNAALVTAPVTSVAASGNLSSSGGTAPLISMTATPSFTSVTTSGTVTITGNSALVVNGTAQFGAPGSGTTVQGVGCSNAGIAQYNAAWRLCLDTSGNVGIQNNITAANFFNGSRRAYKFDIRPLHFDAVGVLKATDWASYRYKPKYGDPHEKKIGFIADDTPAILSGPKHNHFDAGALATVDAQAILQLSQRIDGLEAMVRRLCHQKKNRKEAVCRAFAH